MGVCHGVCRSYYIERDKLGVTDDGTVYVKARMVGEEELDSEILVGDLMGGWLWVNVPGEYHEELEELREEWEGLAEEGRAERAEQRAGYFAGLGNLSRGR